MKIKIRNIHKSPKFFGYSDEKWAKGNGKYGYGRSYGVKYGNAGLHRTKVELQKTIDDNAVLEYIEDYQKEINE